MDSELKQGNIDNDYELFHIIDRLEVADVNVVDGGNFTELPIDVRNNILHQVIPLLERSFGQVYQEDMSDQDVVDFLSNGNLYLILDNEKKIVGIELLQLFSIDNVKVMYGSGAVLDPKYQGKHIHSDFRRDMVEKHKPNYVVGRTQNHIVYHIYCKSPGTVYPAYNKTVPIPIQELACKLSNRFGLANFDPTSLVQKGAYCESIYKKNTYPTIGPDSDIGRLFSKIDINNGDAFLILKTVEYSNPRNLDDQELP